MEQTLDQTFQEWNAKKRKMKHKFKRGYGFGFNNHLYIVVDLVDEGYVTCCLTKAYEIGSFTFADEALMGW